MSNGRPLPEPSRPITWVSCISREAGYTGKTERERGQTDPWARRRQLLRYDGQRQLLFYVH